MSNVLHFLASELAPIENWRTLCGIRACEKEFDATAIPEDVECPKCRALLLTKREPPYPFCHQAEKCIAAGRCERTVRGERWSCAD